MDTDPRFLTALALCWLPGCLTPNPNLGGAEASETAASETDSETSTDTSDSSSSDTDADVDADADTDTDTDTDTGPCEAVGCPCLAPTDCTEGLACIDELCTEPVCGDGEVHGDEECDDSNAEMSDGCDNDCTYTEILDLSAGGTHTCVLIEGGQVKCWGANTWGQLGLGHTLTIGDDETPSQAQSITLPLPAIQIATALGEHTCALLSDMRVRCWGNNESGALGYGHTLNIGDDELPGSPVDVGGDVADITLAARGETPRKMDLARTRCGGDIYHFGYPSAA